MKKTRFTHVLAANLVLAAVAQPVGAVIPLNREKGIEHYDCLAKEDRAKVLELEQTYRDLRDVRNVRISDKYKFNDLIRKDMAYKYLCSDLVDIPSWAEAFCKVREIIDELDESQKTGLRSELGRLYADYIRNHRWHYDQGHDPVIAQPLPEQVLHNRVLRREHDKVDQIQQMFQDGVRKYYLRMREVEKRILEYRDRCRDVPDLIGLSYQKASDAARSAGFDFPVCEPEHVRNLPAPERDDMVVVTQQPAAGTRLDREKQSIYVTLARQLQSIRVKPPEWLDAERGQTAPFEVKALFTGNQERDVAELCTWISKDPNVARPTRTRGEIQARNAGETEIAVLYQYYNGLSNVVCKALLPVKVIDVRRLVSLRVEPSGWTGAEPGETKPFKAFATFKRDPTGEEDVTAKCEWRVDEGENKAVVATSGRDIGKVTIEQAAQDGDRCRVVATFGEGRRAKTAEAPIAISVVSVTDFELRAKGPTTVIPTTTVQVRAWAKYSDDSTKWVDITSKCEWKTEGDPDLAVQNGLVTVRGCTLPPAKHKVSASFTHGGKVRTASLAFQVQKPKAVIGRKYFKLTLNEQAFDLGPGDQHRLMATAWYSEVPRTVPQDVTYDPNSRWDSSDTNVATVSKGVVRAGQAPGSCTISIAYTPPGATQPMTATCKVTVKDRFFVDFKVNPQARTYRVGQEITFTETLEARGKSAWVFTWYIGHEEFNGREITNAFTNPGKYTVRLVASNRVTGVEDAMPKTIEVVGEAEPEPEEKEETGAGGPPPETARPDARWRNRFNGAVTDAGLEICAQYWDAAKAAWSDCRTFRKLPAPPKFIITTGEQSDGINTGWLVYSPQPHTLHYEVYAFDHSTRRPSVRFKGVIDLKGKQVDAASLLFKEVHARNVTAEWSTRDGSLCRTTIWKFPKTDRTGATGGGVEDTGCFESGVSAGKVSSGERCSDERIWAVFPSAREAGFPGVEGKDKKAPRTGYTDYERYWKEEKPGPHGNPVWRSVVLTLQICPTKEEAVRTVTVQYDVAAKYGGAGTKATEMKLGDKAVSLSSGRGTFSTLIAVRNALISAAGQDTAKDSRYMYVQVDEDILKRMVQRTRDLPCDLVPEQAEAPKPTVAVIKYRNTEWLARLVNGKLEVRGAEGIEGSWGKQWKQVAAGVSSFKGVGTGKGPVIIYPLGARWHIVLLDWASGAPQNRRSFEEAIGVTGQGEFGVTIQVGKRCYDYSWNDLREIDCKTRRYK